MRTGAKTVLDICNLAMDHLHEKADIANIDSPETENERLCARHYYVVLEYVLRNYVWNFAKSRALISRDALNAPDFDYADAYKLPSDFVRLLNFNSYESLIDVDYDINGTHLLLNNGGEPTVKLRYIRRVDNVAEFDAGFVHLLSLYLALNLAYKKTGKQTIMDRLAKQIDLAEAKIISIDGQERPPKRIQKSRYRRARNMVNSNSSSRYLVFKD